MNQMLSSALLALTVLAACAHEGSASVTHASPEPVEGKVTSLATPSAPEAPAQRRCAADQDCSASELCVAATCQAIDARTAECAAAVTHFGFDEHTLQEGDFPALQRVARCLTAVRQTGLTVEGYADERGTAAYNLALGARRAAAVQRYLVTLGAEPRQLQTVSYGKERPVCLERDEECWARNRRAELERRF